MILGLYTNETKGFVKDPNHSGSNDAATSGKYTANEPQRALSAQQEGNYNVIPTFNIITIFIALFAGQELAHCVVSSQNIRILNSLLRRDEFQNTHIISFCILHLRISPRQFISEITHKAVLVNISLLWRCVCEVVTAEP